MGWFSSGNVTANATFTSETVAEATADFGHNVAKAIIGDAVAATGTAFAFGPAVAGAQFAKAAMWSVIGEAIKSAVYVSKEFADNGSDFEVNVNYKWMGANPILMTASNKDLPVVFRESIYQKNDDGDSIVTLPDGKKVIYRAGSDCELDAYGTAKDEIFELCNMSENYVNGGSGDDIIKTNGNHDYLVGGLGNDRLYGGSGNDYLFGNSGNDRLYAGIGADKLTGGTGKDIFVVDGNDDVFDFDYKEGDLVVTSGSKKIITGAQWSDSDRLISVDTASGDRFTLDTDAQPYGVDGWTLNEAQWFADNYIFA